MPMLQDKILIVTGSASGIGLACSQIALEEGAKVLGVDRASGPPALEGVDNFHFLQCDLTDASGPSAIVKACTEKFGGRIDALLNVAGVMDFNGSADTLTDDMWDLCMAVNATAPVKLMREVLPFMRQQKKGSIVNVSSKAGVSGAVSGIAYTASKHALVGATKNVAWRFKDDNIRCNAVCPGGTTSGMTTAAAVQWQKYDQDALATMKEIHGSHNRDKSKGMPIAAEDVARMMIFLASDYTPKVSGAIIPVDNAWSTI